MHNPFAITLLAFITLAAAAQDLPGRRLDYPDFRADQAKHPAERPALPSDLVRLADAPSRDHRASRREAAQDALERDAAQAARAAAQELVESFAYREYYKVGFYEGMHRQIREPRPGQGLFETGMNLAAGHASFRREGFDLGAAAAEQDAPRQAEQAVAAQFHDLDRQPASNPAAVRPVPLPFSAAVSYPPPPLEEVMATVARSGFRSRDFYEGWRLEPWPLYRNAGYRDCFDDRWQNADYAFKRFSSDRRAAAAYQRLAKPERERFAHAFRQAYPGHLAQLLDRVQDRAFGEGWREGYDFGWDVRSHWELCSGYAFGAEREVRENARRAYADTFASAYDQAYRRAYDHWRDSVVPELRELTVNDDNGDGVLQPGEFFQLDYTAVNYGGRAGSAELELTSPALEQPIRLTLDLPARDRLQRLPRLEARIDGRTEAWRTYPLWVSLGEDQQQLELRVRNPLNLSGVTVAARDNLNGTLTLLVQVENLSRRPVAETTLRWPGATKELDEVPAQARREQRVNLSGLDPLDLIAGQPGATFELLAEDRLWSSLAPTLPEQVSDLRCDDLLQVLLTLAHAANPEPARVRKAQALWLQRMESDWNAVVATDGNPYKDDARETGARTQLGRLVQAYRSGRNTMAHPEVLADMREDLLALGERLPGTHPFLRKQYRRLAEQL